jgi:hypothetical protein
VTKVQFDFQESQVLKQLKKAASKPETTRPSVEFKRNWAYGNAGLENETITREQVEVVIKK